ncbi:helix-turn-helix transcriptional regulator, partial [Pasteurellaceae bacterium Phil31]
MNKLSLLSAYDVQQSFATYLRQKRKEKKLSRKALAERCLVPEATIKKFETTGQISLRQLLMIWQIVADLEP